MNSISISIKSSIFTKINRFKTQLYKIFKLLVDLKVSRFCWFKLIGQPSAVLNSQRIVNQQLVLTRLSPSDIMHAEIIFFKTMIKIEHPSDVSSDK